MIVVWLLLTFTPGHTLIVRAYETEHQCLAEKAQPSHSLEHGMECLPVVLEKQKETGK
jgi:hypothetical protein